MSIIFGNLANAFVGFGTAVESGVGIDDAAAHFRHVASLDATYLVYIGLGMFVCTFTYMYTWVYTGEMTSKRIREKYLRAILRQEVAFFDNVGAGEVATRIQTDTRQSHTNILLCITPLTAVFRQISFNKACLRK